MEKKLKKNQNPAKIINLKKNVKKSTVTRPQLFE
jgi:hypothetical protein